MLVKRYRNNTDIPDKLTFWSLNKMSSYKKSKGIVVYTTPFPDELQRYVMYELENAKRWNKDMIKGGMTRPNQWSYTMVPLAKPAKTLWQITYSLGKITVTSAESRVHIRQGLYFDMGNGQLVIGGGTPLVKPTIPKREKE